MEVSEPRPSRLRWVMIALAFLATVINYLDRQALSVLTPVLREEFSLSNDDYGTILMGFMLAYCVMNAVSGRLIDRVGTRIGYAVCVLFWSLAALSHSLAVGFWSLALCRLLLGIGEAGNWPAAVRVVAEWFPARERALASGIFNSGSAIGAILAPPLVLGVTARFGWQAAFLLTGAMGLVWLAVWIPVYRTPPESQGPATAPLPVTPPRVASPSVREYLRSPFMRRFTLAKFFLDPCWYFYIFWFPEYLKRARGFDMKEIAFVAAVPFISADIGNLAGGFFARFLIGRGFSLRAARSVTIACFCVCMTAAIPAVLVTSPAASVALVSLATFGYTGCSANMLSLPADIFPKSAVSTVYGVASMGAGLGGVVFLKATGLVLDRYQSYVPVFMGFGLMPLVCAAIIWRTLRTEPR